MATQEEFDAAIAAVNGLANSPGQGDQLKLYGLFKQASKGDASGKRPGMMDIRGRAKFDAWAGHKGKTQEAARAAYIELAKSLGAAL